MITPRPKLMFVLVTALAVASAFAAEQQSTLSDGMYADLRTTKGQILLQLEFEKTPMTVANFVGLAEGTIENKALPIGMPFFDGTVFHRVVPGHVIQAGRPKASETGPGYTFPNEIDSSLSHGRAGMLGMANGGPHTNSSQFYITLGDRSYLDGNYTVFGHVVRGLDVVNAIVQGDLVESVKIVRVGKAANAFKADTVSFRQMTNAARARVQEADERKEREENDQIAKQWRKAAMTLKGARMLVVRDGTGEQPASGSRIKVIYTGHSLNGENFASSADQGKPVPGSSATAFEFEIGKTHITEALDEALATMRKGERRIVIARGPLAYGTAGFYATEKPGEKRFVISPNTTLIYEVEWLER